MRRTYNSEFLKDDTGSLIGLSFGADFTSEHEWGIKRLNELFGIELKGYGPNKYAVTKVPDQLIFDSKKGYLLAGVKLSREKIDLWDYEIGRGKGDNSLKTAWDDKSFGISFKKDDRRSIEEIHQAILNKDICIWLGGKGIFQNAGLVVAIRSKIPQDKAQVMKEMDLDREALLKAAADTGIEALLKNARKSYFALSPAWLRKDSKKESNYSVMFWLNPLYQDRYKAGWYSVEELNLWVKDEGPVLKVKKNETA